MKKLFFCLMAATALFACEPGGTTGGDKDEEGAVIKLEFQMEEYFVQAKQSVKLVVMATPENATNLDEITFTSEFDSIGTVTNKGFFQADTLSPYIVPNAGTTTITAKVGDVTATTTVNVHLVQERVEMKNWLGFFDYKTRPNPNFDSSISYEDYQNDSAARSTNAYMDSFIIARVAVLCNNMGYENGSGFVGSSSDPVFFIDMCFAQRSSSTEFPKGVNFILSDPDPANVNGGYTVQEDWLTDADAKPGYIQAGMYSEEDFVDWWNDQAASMPEYTGSVFNHMLSGGMYSPVNTCVVKEADFRFCSDDAQVDYLGASYCKYAWPLPGGEGTEVTEMTEYEFETYSEGPTAAAAARSYKNMGAVPANLFNVKNNVNKAMNMAAISRVALDMPSVLK